MDTLDTLTELFQKFPGIGPRQARRFVLYLLRASPQTRRDIEDAIHRLGSGVSQCTLCQRFFEGTEKTCGLCRNTARDHTILMLVAHDQDLDAMERTHAYSGMYFVTGGTVQFGAETHPHIRLSAFEKRLATTPALTEIIFALPANPEGDATARLFKDIVESKGMALTTSALARGLSSGTEIEYADPDTLTQAFTRRA